MNGPTNTDTIRLLLSAADSLRAAAADDGALGAGYRQSSEGLAALIEAWCIDHGGRLAPEIFARLTDSQRDSDASVLRAFRKHLAGEGAPK